VVENIGTDTAEQTENMSSRSPPSEKIKTKAPGMENSNLTDSATNGEQSASSENTPEKQEKKDSLESEIEPQYATGLRLFLIMLTIFMNTLLAALEIGIVATAIPAITDDFHRLDDVGWYGSATFLLVGATAPMWGKLYKYLNVKYAYLGSVVLYLLGSILAAAAPNSESVIIGRAIQGLGASGTLGGSLIVINYVTEPKRRPLLIGSWMGVFMVSTILGPVIGGAFTSGISWRWCFWINLPLGVPIIVLLMLFLHIPKHIKPSRATWMEVILQLDLPGFGAWLASLVCLTLALQWGGQTRSWSDPSVVATLVLWLALFFFFFVVEWFQGERGMVPLRLLRPRLTWSNALYCFM